MPKPDQNISISAALQRPQRQKALPKPLTKNIETDLQPEIVSETVPEEVEVALELPLESTQPELDLPKFTEPIIEIKKAIADKNKPVLKPKLKPEIKLQVKPVIEHSIPKENLETPTLVTNEIVTDKNDEAVVEIASEVEHREELFDPAAEDREFEDSQFETEQLEDNRSLDPVLDNPSLDKQEKSNQLLEPALPIFWCQAVGLVEAKYIPSPEVFHKGELLRNNGTSYKAYVLSKAVKALEKKIDLSMAHQFVVYPKTSKLNGIRFEILATDVSSKIEEFEDGQFNIRGFVTKQLEKAFLVEIQRRPEYLHPTQYDRFTLEVRGEIPAELVQQYVYLKCQLIESYLNIVSYEHLACPYTSKPPARLTKTEKPILKSKSVILTEIANNENIESHANQDIDRLESVQGEA